MPAPSERLPPRTLPIVYVACAHVSLVLAFLLVALEPARFMFFYQRHTFALVHLVTLGWITSTTLGLSYVAGPLALRMTVRAGWWDAAACVLFLIGASGVITHFWLDEYSAVAWAGVLLLPAFVVVAVRILKGLAGASAPLPVRLHIGVAYVNLLLAAALAIHLALRKSGESHSVPRLHVYAHAHLAAAGWATLMVMGMGYRIFAMLLPAAPPGNRPAWATLVLFETGLVGLTWALLSDRPPGVFAVLMAGAVVVFLGTVLRMLRNPRPPPVKLKRPDFGVLHVAQALLCLAVATGFGLFLAFSSEPSPAGAMVYGVLGLVGFLAQTIVGVEMRLLPMFAFTEAFARSGFQPNSPHDMPRRPLQALSLVAWTAGVPLLAWGLAGEVGESVGEGAARAGASLLLLGTLAAAASTARVLRRAYGPSRG